MFRLKEKYTKEIIPAMLEKFGYKNIMAVPKVEKVVLNTGVGRLIIGKTADEQKKIIESIINDLSVIAGQKAVGTKAKKAIATFKTRKGMTLGVRVTLRGKKMYDFIERLVCIALPRSRDFQGINPKSVDERGNFTIAVKEHIAFPEISPEKSKNIFGFEVTIATTAKTSEEGLELVKLLGFPTKK